MNSKTIKSLLIIFVGLLAIVVGFHYLNQSSSESKFKTTADFNLADFTEDSVKRFNIKRGDEEKAFSYEGELWKINGEEALPEKIGAFFKSIAEVKIKEVASKNPDNHENFGISKEEVYILTFNQNGKDYVFFIGKSGSLPELFYIKKKGSRNIYLASGNLRSLISQEASQWIESEEEKEESKEL